MVTVDVVQEQAQDDVLATAVEVGSSLDVLAREGARRMLAAALQAEVAAYIGEHAHEVDERGHRLVVRNGTHAERWVTTAAGAVAVVAPRVDDRRVDPATGARRRFTSAILPAWARRSPGVNEVLPLLYLHGLSTQDMVPALEDFLGSGANLSAPVIQRLTVAWQDEQRAFAARDLSRTDYVYVWADGSTSTSASRASGCACWCWSACAPTAARS